MIGPVAHSAKDGRPAQSYEDHVIAVRDGAIRRATEMLAYGPASAAGLADVVASAATFHDMGKLDDENQAVLTGAATGGLPWDHIDAGCAHLVNAGQASASMLVMGHHAPGLPSTVREFRARGMRLRGRRHRVAVDAKYDRDREIAQIHRTDAHLADYLAAHSAAVSAGPASRQLSDALEHRLALSCLVDADHEDTSRHYGYPSYRAPACRWQERLEALDTYVAGLSDPHDSNPRNRQRRDFYRACRTNALHALAACEASVGMGKTTSVLAYLLRHAIEGRLRRIIIVAPLTTVISQTVDVLRRAIVLPGEDPHAVVAEHHHKVDYDSGRARAMAQLWSAPIVVTTSVQLCDTLASRHPGKLRKLHALPGSAIMFDEMQSMLPAPLWRQNWQWFRQLVDSWSCRIVLASGSLIRVWTQEPIVGDGVCQVPEIMPPALNDVVLRAERQRITYHTIRQRMQTADDLVQHAMQQPGPRLIVMNTLDNARAVYRAVEARGIEVLHISTALTPNDRERAVARVRARLAEADGDWCLVATSCIEAGVDISLRTGYRERSSASSLIQTGGRTNRHNEYGHADMFDFAVSTAEGTGMNMNPALRTSASVLERLFRQNVVGTLSPADLVTEAMRREIADNGGETGRDLARAEKVMDFPRVQELGQVIADDATATVVIEQSLIARLEQGEIIPPRELVRGSVSMRFNRIARSPVDGVGDVRVWRGAYDPDGLGYLA